MIRLCAIADANEESGWTRIINGFHEVIKILAEADPLIVVYPFPKRFKTPPKILKPYTIDNVNEKEGCKKWSDKYDLGGYVDRTMPLKL